MNFTAKEDYGIRAVLDIALHQAKVPIQAREIAARQGIPEQFLEQVLAALRRAGVVRSIRGASGGYDLAKPAHQTTVGEIIRALSGPIVPMDCVSEGEFTKCDKQGSCGVTLFWCKLKEAILGVVDGTSIQDLVDGQADRQKAQSFMMNI